MTRCSVETTWVFLRAISCLPVDISVFVVVWLCSNSYLFHTVSCYHRVGFGVLLHFLWLQLRITLIVGPAGWRAVFPNEKREVSADWRTAQKTEGRAGGLHKKVVRRAAEKGMLQKRAALQTALFRSPVYCAARLNVQPTGPSCTAASRSALLSMCSSPACGKSIFLIWQHGPPARPALHLVLSAATGLWSERMNWCNISVFWIGS